MVYVVPLVCLAVGILVAHVACRHGRWVVPAALALAIGGVMAWMIYLGRQAQGWDGIGYAIVAMLMCLPAILGMGIGVLTGLYRRRKDRQQAAHDTPPLA